MLKFLEVSDKSKDDVHILPNDDRETPEMPSPSAARKGHTSNRMYGLNDNAVEETGFVDDPDVPPLM